jgi:hypothetical protein
MILVLSDPAAEPTMLAGYRGLAQVSPSDSVATKDILELCQMADSEDTKVPSARMTDRIRSL